MPHARPPRIFPITGAAALLVVCAVVSVALLIEAAVRAGIGEVLLLTPWVLLVLWIVYVAGIASDIRADRSGALVQNLLRRTWMPWGRVRRVGMRWQVEFTLDDGTVVRCFGGPTASRPRRLGPGRTKEEAGAPAHDGLAALQRLRLDAELDPDAAMTKTWDWASIACLAVLAAWAAAAVLITR